MDALLQSKIDNISELKQLRNSLFREYNQNSAVKDNFSFESHSATQKVNQLFLKKLLDFVGVRQPGYTADSKGFVISFELTRNGLSTLNNFNFDEKIEQLNQTSLEQSNYLKRFITSNDKKREVIAPVAAKKPLNDDRDQTQLNASQTDIIPERRKKAKPVVTTDEAPNLVGHAPRASYIKIVGEKSGISAFQAGLISRVRRESTSVKLSYTEITNIPILDLGNYDKKTSDKFLEQFKDYNVFAKQHDNNTNRYSVHITGEHSLKLLQLQNIQILGAPNVDKSGRV